MKHYTNKELKEILEDMKSGTVYTGILPNGYGEGRIYYGYGNNYKPYIFWRSAGASANSPTLKEFRWLLEVIFENCELITPAVWSDYHINYIPIDTRYKGFDNSMKHPNVCGL